LWLDGAAFQKSPIQFPGNTRLWHTKCFYERRQARKKLNRDPAAITSLSVACRYASRPPSVPTINPIFQEPGPQSQVLPLLDFFFSALFSAFFDHPVLSPCGDYPLTLRRPAATRGRAPKCQRDKNCHFEGDDLRRFGPFGLTI
jgi:hypothetical protein